MVSDSAPRAFGSLLAWEDARVGFRMAVTGIPPIGESLDLDEVLLVNFL